MKNRIPKISIIAAIGSHRELGKDNKLLWHIPEDLKRFKKLTSGHAVIMGQRTFESIGKLLPNRINIVLSHDVKEFKTKHQYFFCHSGTKRDCPESDSGCAQRMSRLTRMTVAIVVSSINKAIQEAKRVEKEEVFIIGGGMIYKQFLPLTDKLYLTLVEGKYEADTYFPEYEKMFTQKIFEEKHDNGINKFKFTIFSKPPNTPICTS